ncbi:MAG: Gfo/Idh/MocA family oxidoreductase [Sedimentisphaerales bacterium]|nr:Gfo/Idh/MocA family oxidoreductase [Sedimentisphaerales bacterium]HNY79129.1 Gfo/Idh/MocA family oxidoreductase [Sedimentisphaerales bacterium]HOC64171.1 Gfo/Idh/MocA family oxidoreductase [Sedimentisphaerales bacterium]HOH65037.1 Gfo/Idh/MocA family oxidoreductase [Sedimentisphaerales bacterium]HPY49935.1 Gfo/Idh/MocA family oxidoreductase [Sedimentisphaerales bacterium]
MNDGIKHAVSRRDFMKGAAAGVVSAAVASGLSPRAFAAGSDKIRVGLIGCGGRGMHDTSRFLVAAENVELIAMGDLFKDSLDRCRAALTRQPKEGEDPNPIRDKVKVTDETCFVGWDAYKKVLATNVDVVILTTAPHFRPMHIRAAFEAGKHVFAEKPVAVDPVGVRSVIASAELADQKGLTFVAGTQMRRISHLVEAMKRIRDGALGTIQSGQCFRLGDAMRGWGPSQRRPQWSDMEWQLRRWLFMTWLSGDFIVEMHVHDLDVINWALGGPPVQCFALGGRQQRTEPEYGDSYDHFAVEYEYANGVSVSYKGTQQDGISNPHYQHIVGTKGSARLDFGRVVITGPNAAEIGWDRFDPCLTQHADQIAAIRQGKRLNEGKRIAESTMTAIMGRMSAYTGRALKWDWVMNASKLDLAPPAYEFGTLAMPEVAVPGKTRLV